MWFYRLPRDVQIDVLAVLAPEEKTTAEGREFWTGGK
jgi:hypothetical protein